MQEYVICFEQSSIRSEFHCATWPTQITSVKDVIFSKKYKDRFSAHSIGPAVNTHIYQDIDVISKLGGCV